MRPAAAVLLLLCLVWAPAGEATAQMPTGNLYGTVTDSGGEPLPGVRVELTGVGAPRVQYTDAQGHFRFLGLEPGEYSALVALEGFSTQEYSGVSVGVGRNTTLEVTLSTDVEEVITVTGEQPLPTRKRTSRPAWNTWVEVRDAVEPEPVPRLQVGGSYEFHLDLARLAYEHAGVASGRVSDPFLQELRRAFFDPPRRVKLTARVHPVLVGRAIRPLGGRLRLSTWRQGEWVEPAGDGMAPFEIRLAQLFEDGVSEPAPSLGWRERTDLSRAGGLRIPVEAVEPGCAAITVSIWDEAGHLPLDHVAHVVAVGDRECSPGGLDTRSRPGFLGLLLEEPGLATHAALELYEVEVEPGRPSRTLAVYVPASPTGGCRRFAWEAPGSVSSYLFENRFFAATIRRAWRDRDRNVFPELARQLRDVLFPRRPAPSADGCGGWEALEALRELASTPGRRLFVRLVDSAHRSLFLPLGLLFALEVEEGETGAATPAFPEPPTLRQPLPIESFGEPDRCIGRWSYLLPESLAGYPAPIELPQSVAGDPDTTRALGGLSDFLEEVQEDDGSWYTRGGGRRDCFGEARPVGEPGVGLVLLAHHQDGVLYLADPEDLSSELELWMWTELREACVPRGSVALLSACSTGDLSESTELVTALNEAGFETIILSPFEVPTRFGVSLAVTFSELVVEHRRRGDDASVAELFELALGETVKTLTPEMGHRARGLALQFLIAGKGGPHLCPESRP